MKTNKVILGTEVLIDLTEDSITEDKMLQGETAHDKSGEIIQGSIPIIEEDGYVYFSNKEQTYTVQPGYHPKGTVVQISEEEQSKVLSENIKDGVSILGIDGEFTSDGDVEESDILFGKTAYSKGQRIVGTCTFDADTSDADSEPGDILFGKTAYVNGEKIEGVIPIYPTDPSEAEITITVNDLSYNIPEGYHDGTETVDLGETANDILPENVKDGVEILGMTGTFTSDADATADYILQDKVAYSQGQRIVGTCTFDADTSDATAEPSDLAFGKTAYVNGKKITGIGATISSEDVKNAYGTTLVINLTA